MALTIASLEKMGTWDIVPLPEGRKPVSCRWVYRIKYDADGNVSRYKARLVACGYSQIHSLDYEETYAPVTHLETICLLFAIAVKKDWEIRQVDVKTVYLYGDLDEEIYMDPPLGYKVPEGSVLHLKKALYSLKQAGRQWHQKLKSVMLEFGLKQIANDPHTFVTHKVVNRVQHTLLLPIYVDNLLPIGDKVLTDEFKAWIPTYFDVALTGDASYFLGIRVTQDRLCNSPWVALDQVKFVDTVLTHFNIPVDSKKSTPLSPSKDLVPTDKSLEINPE